MLPLLLPLQQCTPASDVDSDRLMTTVEEVRIGGREGTRETMFGAVHHLAVGRDGAILIADTQATIVRMFDRNGIFLRNVGRQGSGPGEYRRIAGLETFPDGRIVIWDPGSQGVHLYNPEGGYLTTHHVQSSISGSDVLRAGHNGTFYVKSVLDYSPTLPNWKTAWLVIDPEGSIADTIRVPMDPEKYEQAYVLYTASGSAYPFFDRQLSTLSPHGYLITGRHGDYNIHLNRRDAEPVVLSRNTLEVLLQTDEKRQWEAWTRHYGTITPIPDKKPPVRNFFTDADGRIWVWRHVEAVHTVEEIGPSFGPESNWWEPPVYDVFLADGSYHATVRMPMNASFRTARGNHVYAVERGEYGEQYVVRFRLEEFDG